jgi:putative DNA primase/helicase
VQQRYNDGGYGTEISEKGRLKVTRASEIRRQLIDWLLEGKIALGKPTLIAGDPGLGKSLVTVDIASRVSTGRDWPANGGTCPLGDVLMVSGEDDPSDTIRPVLKQQELILRECIL